MAIVKFERLSDAEDADVGGQPVKRQGGEVGSQYYPSSHTHTKVLCLLIRIVTKVGHSLVKVGEGGL